MKVITHGLADMPEPVTVETVVTPALVRAVLRFAAVMFQSMGAVVFEVNRELEGASQGGANIHIVDSASHQ